MASEKIPLFEQVANQLIEQLEKGTSPFQKPWTDEVSNILPYNPTTNNTYRGMNLVWLMMQGYSDPRWVTFKQAQSKGWSVEKGTKGTMINYVKTHNIIKLRDDSGKPILDEKGKQKTATVKLDNPIITSAYVFNAERIKGIPELKQETTQEQKWENIKRVEKLVRNSGVSVQHGGNSAFYNLATDKITMPKKTQFDEAAKYYSTLLHEMGHWTGHPNRLNREMLNAFGSIDYAKEELRAEIASLMLGGDLSLGRDYSQHVSYVKSWVSILKDEPYELYRASAEAQKIRDYILQFENKRAIKQTPSESQTLKMHDVIKYQGVKYKVSGLLPYKNLHLTNLDTGVSFRLTPDDKLYASLVKAKNETADHTQDKQLSNTNNQNRDHVSTDTEIDESVNRTFKR